MTVNTDVRNVEKVLFCTLVENTNDLELINTLLRTYDQSTSQFATKMVDCLLHFIDQGKEGPFKKLIVSLRGTGITSVFKEFIKRSCATEQAYLLIRLETNKEDFLKIWVEEKVDSTALINELTELDHPIPDCLLEKFDPQTLYITPQAFSEIVTRVDLQLQTKWIARFSVKEKALVISKLEKFEVLESMFASLSEDEIVELICELVKLKSSSTLLIICYIPTSKFSAVKKLKGPITLREVVNLCTLPKDINLFLNKVTWKRLTILGQAPINGLNESLIEVIYSLNEPLTGPKIAKLRSIPPLLILMAVNLKFSMLTLAPHMTRNYKRGYLDQIPFLAMFAKKEDLIPFYEYLKANNHATTLYSLLKSLALSPRTVAHDDSLSLQEIAPRINNTINLLYKDLGEKLKEVGKEPEDIYFFYQAKRKEAIIRTESADRALADTIKKVESLTFAAMIAPYSSSMHLLSRQYLPLDALCRKSKPILANAVARVVPQSDAWKNRIYISNDKWMTEEEFYKLISSKNLIADTQIP